MAPGAVESAYEELERARDALRAGRLLLDGGFVNAAVSQLYYALFHAARAALTTRDVHAKTHSGQATLFRATFGPHPLLEDTLRLRSEADYGAGVRKPIDKLRALEADVAAFVDECDAIVAEAAAHRPDEPDPPPDL